MKLDISKAIMEYYHYEDDYILEGNLGENIKKLFGTIKKKLREFFEWIGKKIKGLVDKIKTILHNIKPSMRNNTKLLEKSIGKSFYIEPEYKYTLEHTNDILKAYDGTLCDDVIKKAETEVSNRMKYAEEHISKDYNTSIENLQQSIDYINGEEEKLKGLREKLFPGKKDDKSYSESVVYEASSKFEPRKGFVDAVKRKDIKELRNRLAEVIRYDYRLGKDTIDDYMNYLRDNNIDVTEGYRKLHGEKDIPQDKSKWDKYLFYNQVEVLRQNFAYEKRIKDIRMIGDIVFNRSKTSKRTSEKTSLKPMQKYDEIEKGIETKDVKSLRYAVGSIVYTDRAFRGTEFDDVVKYVEAHGIKLKDDRLVGNPAISSVKDSFTDDDFARAVFELKNNFCDERIEDVKKIGKALYGGKNSKSSNSKDLKEFKYDRKIHSLIRTVVIDSSKTEKTVDDDMKKFLKLRQGEIDFLQEQCDVFEEELSSEDTHEGLSISEIKTYYNKSISILRSLSSVSVYKFLLMGDAIRCSKHIYNAVLVSAGGKV